MPQIPVQAIYVPQQDELELAWYVGLGTALYVVMLCQKSVTSGKLPTKWQIAATVICAGLGYAIVVDLLEYAVGHDDWWCVISEFPNLVAGFAGFISHNLPDLYTLASDRLKKKVRGHDSN